MGGNYFRGFETSFQLEESDFWYSKRVLQRKSIFLVFETSSPKEEYNFEDSEQVFQRKRITFAILQWKETTFRNSK